MKKSFTEKLDQAHRMLKRIGNQSTERVFNCIFNNPGITQEEVAEIIRMSQPCVSSNADLLADYRVIRKRDRGKFVHYQANQLQIKHINSVTKGLAAIFDAGLRAEVEYREQKILMMREKLEVA